MKKAIKKAAEELDISEEIVAETVDEFFKILNRMIKTPFKKILINNLCSFNLQKKRLRDAIGRTKYNSKLKKFLENEEG